MFLERADAMTPGEPVFEVFLDEKPPRVPLDRNDVFWKIWLDPGWEKDEPYLELTFARSKTKSSNVGPGLLVNDRPLFFQCLETGPLWESVTKDDLERFLAACGVGADPPFLYVRERSSVCSVPMGCYADDELLILKLHLSGLSARLAASDLEKSLPALSGKSIPSRL